MVRLCISDLEALLAFAADSSVLDTSETYTSDVLTRVRELVRCEAITYQDCDLLERRFLAVVGVGDDEDDEDDEDLYWSTGPCPIAEYRARTGDLSVLTMSDLVERRHYHALPVFQEYFRPGGVDHVIDLGLPAAPHRHRSLVLFRATGSGDFSGRDRAVLEALRPLLLGLEKQGALRRQLASTLAAQEDSMGTFERLGLTTREREIVDLVAEGKTNAQIASQLWVAPSTVKKHLENVYAKLGVGRRAAAATLLRAAR